MTSQSTGMRVDPMVALQEAAAREAFLKERTFFLAQSLENALEEKRQLTEALAAAQANAGNVDNGASE